MILVLLLGAWAGTTKGEPPENAVGSDATTASLSDSGVQLEPVVLGTPEFDPGPPDVIVVDESVEMIDESECCEPDQPKVSFGDWVGYNATKSNTTWLAGGDFGMFSLESFPSLDFGKDSALMLGSGFHFLDGPNTPDMPPRLFDFQIAYQARKVLSKRLMIDIRLGAGAFSDFEGSARKGIRFPSHFVSYFDHNDCVASVLGIDVLDRDDISALPVAGVVWRPHDDLVLECVFPRPRIQLRTSADRAMYFGGELGGGTWAIQRDDGTNDNTTYRDLRVTWGIANFDKGVNESTMEIGWAFDRSLQFRSGRGDTDFDGAFILRWHVHY